MTTKPLNIVLIGDPRTGKINLLSRLTKNHFNPMYEPTTGINEITYAIQVGTQRVETYIWELAGRKRYRHLANQLLCDADGILLVYDVSNPASFENLAAWLRHIRQVASPKTVIKLVGNKNDLQTRVPSIQAYHFATDNGLSSIETSALNDNHVHLAFESIAQEIDVVIHSVSEPPTDPFAQKDAKASSDEDQQEKPFQVVLIDIRQAARDKKIVCVEKPLEDADFIAISYSWGEVYEQVVDTKLGYKTSVTSFALKDFYTLCSDILDEPDLKSIKYAWVDAICVDQNNHARRKATIYQMSNIYHHAAYILAVPDLHLEYLKNIELFDDELQANAPHFKLFIYYLLQEKVDQLDQITEKWFDDMNIPKATMARKQITGQTWVRFTNYLDVYNEQEADSPCPSRCKHNCYNECPKRDYVTRIINCHKTPKAMLDHIQYSINMIHNHSANTTMVYENSDCALCSLQMNMCKHQKKSLNKNETIPESDKKWLACVLREIRYDKYRGLVADRAKAVAKFTKYLENLIEDWSSRVWVISEYNIAKAKQSRKLKFWFLSLGVFGTIVKKLGFFAFDFDKVNANVLYSGDYKSLNQVILRANDRYKWFQETLISQLNERSFVEMMLDSKASRNEDRFYAIFPSSEYKTMLTSREVVSSWQIDNIVSVKLKLFESMTIKDKLSLLYWLAYSNLKSDCTFPAFANINIGKVSAPSFEERDEENRPSNFDLNNNATLRLVPPMENENGFHFHKLNLSPKMYYVIRPDGNRFRKENVFENKQRFWEALEVNYGDDDLVYVRIPMYMYYIDKHYSPKDIMLFGCFKKNKWLLCQTHDANEAIKKLPFKDYDNSDGNISFDIY